MANGSRVETDNAQPLIGSPANAGGAPAWRGVLRRAIKKIPARIRYPLLHAIRPASEAVERIVARRRARRQADSLIRELRGIKAEHPDKVLCGILLVEHIGDIIACEPILGWVRREFPNALVVWLVRTPYRELLADHPGVDVLLTVDSLASVSSIVKSGVFDSCFDLHVNRKPTGIEGITHDKTWGDPSVDSATYFKYHSILQAFSQAAGIPPFTAPPTMYVSDRAVKAVDSLGLPRLFVAVHPSSNDDTRDWSTEEWEKLIRYVLDDCALPVLELGLRAVLSVTHPRFQSFCGRLSVMETAEVVRRSAFFVGVDSGLAHMANAWQRPALLLFGRFHGQDQWRPYTGFYAERPDWPILRHHGPLAELRASAVIERLRADEEWIRVVASEKANRSLQSTVL